MVQFNGTVKTRGSSVYAFSFCLLLGLTLVIHKYVHRGTQPENKGSIA